MHRTAVLRNSVEQAAWPPVRVRVILQKECRIERAQNIAWRESVLDKFVLRMLREPDVAFRNQLSDPIHNCRDAHERTS